MSRSVFLNETSSNPPPQLLGTATEQLSFELGQTLSGLLNASFGNAVEIIVGITALMQGELRIVQTSVRLISVSCRLNG